MRKEITAYRAVKKLFEQIDYPFYVTNTKKAGGTPLDKKEYFRRYCDALIADGYITIQIAIDWIHKYDLTSQMYYISSRHVSTKRWVHDKPGYATKAAAEEALGKKSKHPRYEYRIVYSSK